MSERKVSAKHARERDHSPAIIPHMPPDISGPFNVRTLLHAWSLALFLLAFASASLLALPQKTEAAITLSKPPNNLGLVGYWSFDEGIGTIATDFSGNGNHGTLTNMEAADWVNGKRGRALNFDGNAATEYVNAGTGLSITGPSARSDDPRSTQNP